MPLTTTLVPSGTRVFDWEVPEEWQLQSAHLTGPEGERIADAAVSNLHVLNYSAPVDMFLDLGDLQSHLYSLPQLPDAIPYVTSYYKRTWGFCLTDRVRRSLPPGKYHAYVDSAFVAGGVPIAQCVLPGESSAEILISSYLCHPSMANNELSGPLVLLGLYERLRAWGRRRFTYRFVLNPETIGSLCYLHLHGDALRQNLVAGLVLTCLGGPGPLSYKLSRRGDSLFDRLMRADETSGIALRQFDPTSGSDERQYCSPGFNLPVGQLARSVYGQYDGYHNSLDDKAFMTIGSLVRSISEIEALLLTAEISGPFRNLSPFGEPQLSKRGLYPTTNASSTRAQSTDEIADARDFLNKTLTILNYSDGENTMLEIAARIGEPVEKLRPVVERLEAVGLLAIDPPANGL
jgi:aminopeptidase-like protein